MMKWMESACEPGPRKSPRNLVSEFRVSPPISFLFSMKTKGLKVGRVENQERSVESTSPRSREQALESDDTAADRDPTAGDRGTSGE